MSLVAQERTKYEDMWAVDIYNRNSPGERLVEKFVEMTGASPGDSVLDAGCGAGRGMLALAERGFRVSGCDLTDAALLPEAKRFVFYERCLWEPLWIEADWAYCCDVLEHIPPQFTMLAVVRLLEAARLGAFLSISHIPDNYGAWIGQTLHQTVQPYVWWRDNLAAVGELVEARDLLISGLYVVRARR